MSESIQFRGPLEVEGPDDLDDDDNYMKPGLETAGLKNRQQKDQPSKKSLYFAVGCFITGLLYFYSTYDSPQQQYSPNYSTKTLFGCNRNQYFTPKECEFSSQECYLSVEFTGKCVVCNTGYSLNNGECKNCQETQNCTQQNLYANLYRSTNHPTEEIPYVIVNKENSQRILYVFETNLFDHLSNYSSLENITIVQVEDYSLLNSPSYQPIITDFIKYIETRLLNQKERIFLAHQTKAQGLITYLKSINSNDTVFIVEPQNLEEVFTPNGQYLIPLGYNKLLENSNLKIKLLYSTDQPEGFTCKKSNRILENSDKPTEVDVEEDESEEEGEEIVEEEEEKKQTPIIQEVECVKIQDGNFISQLISLIENIFQFKMNQAPVIQTNSPVSTLLSPGFETLSANEKLYAYHFARASWEGARICYFQKSYEAPGLFYIFHKIFSNETPSAVETRLINQAWTHEEIQQLFVYVAAVFQNTGNYKSFGDSKFIPEVSQAKFEEFVTTSPGYQVDEVWGNVSKYIYNYDKPYGLIDLKEKNGSNSYYSPGLSAELLEAVDKFLIEKRISELNTRVIQVGDEIQVLVASVNQSKKELGEVHGHKVVLVYGDYAPFLQSVVKHLQEAHKYAANENQKKMIESYIDHFQVGDVELHKQSQRHWIKDKGPVIETNIGFIETYLDPLKVRAEWEGFVAVVNKKESALLNGLVDQAEQIIKYLPWPKEFEVDQYRRPDFTSLEVLAFASSGTPLGINIPNYDDIRQTEGFKNVNLGNTIGKLSKEFIKFLDPEDLEIFYNYQSEAIFVIVALHELIGHGAGKIFMKDENGKFNFDFGNTVNPLTNKTVETFYNHGEQWHSKFGEFSGAMEECKADATALYLSTYDDVVQLLLPNSTADDRQKIVFAGWLFVVYRAVCGLEFYNPEQKKWGQAHVLARNVILQSLIREDPDIIKITETVDNGKPYIHFKFDKTKLYTSGKKAISNLILHLQVFKSTGAGKEGVEFFSKLAAMSEQFLKIRDIVIQNKTPRKLEQQPELLLKDGQVILQQYEQTFAGIIESQVAHHQENIEETKALFLQVQKHFQN